MDRPYSMRGTSFWNGIALAALFISSPAQLRRMKKDLAFTSDQIHWAPFRDGAEIATLAAIRQGPAVFINSR